MVKAKGENLSLPQLGFVFCRIADRYVDNQSNVGRHCRGGRPTLPQRTLRCLILNTCQICTRRTHTINKLKSQYFSARPKVRKNGAYAANVEPQKLRCNQPRSISQPNASLCPSKMRCSSTSAMDAVHLVIHVTKIFPSSALLVRMNVKFLLQPNTPNTPACTNTKPVPTLRAEWTLRRPREICDFVLALPRHEWTFLLHFARRSRARDWTRATIR
jgi:hypothetical protein